MSELVRSIAFNILARGKAFPTTLTDHDKVQALVRKLQPVNTAKGLRRLGPTGDGGYLVPDDLSGIEACYSPGVSFISGFEKDCADLGMKVFMADRSVEQPAEWHALFHFTKKYVGVTTDDDFMTIDNWVASTLPDAKSDLMLQIDIEGYEYEAFLAMSDALLARFRIIVAEFHNLNQLWNQPFFGVASRAFEKILQTHTCVHIHPNNFHPTFERWGLSIPPAAEFTFLRKDRVVDPVGATVFPHPLDSDSSPKAHFALPKCWYDNPQ